MQRFAVPALYISLPVPRKVVFQLLTQFYPKALCCPNALEWIKSYAHHKYSNGILLEGFSMNVILLANIICIFFLTAWLVGARVNSICAYFIDGMTTYSIHREWLIYSLSNQQGKLAAKLKSHSQSHRYWQIFVF